MPAIAYAATDLDLISYLKVIPDGRMRRGVRFPAWYLLQVAVLGILSGCQSLRDLERFASRHRIPRFASSFCRWTWRRSARLSATGRLLRSLAVQRISIS